MKHKPKSNKLRYKLNPKHPLKRVPNTVPLLFNQIDFYILFNSRARLYHVATKLLYTLFLSIQLQVSLIAYILIYSFNFRTCKCYQYKTFIQLQVRIIFQKQCRQNVLTLSTIIGNFLHFVIYYLFNKVFIIMLVIIV